MKRSYIALTVLLVAASAALLVQLWFELWSSEIFTKLMITLGVLLALTGILIAIRHDTKEEDALRKDKHLN